MRIELVAGVESADYRRLVLAASQQGVAAGIRRVKAGMRLEDDVELTGE
jgi:hypothetical protein